MDPETYPIVVTSHTKQKHDTCLLIECVCALLCCGCHHIILIYSICYTCHIYIIISTTSLVLLCRCLPFAPITHAGGDEDEKSEEGSFDWAQVCRVNTHTVDFPHLIKVYINNNVHYHSHFSQLRCPFVR